VHAETIRAVAATRPGALADGVQSLWISPARAAVAAAGGRLTASEAARIIERMSETHPAPVEQELKQLEQRVDELVAMLAQLQEENRALRQRQDAMMTERAMLLQKNEQVRARVEAMIGRLKAMEHSA
jgi:cell division protein ZapB